MVQNVQESSRKLGIFLSEFFTGKTQCQKEMILDRGMKCTRVYNKQAPRCSAEEAMWVRTGQSLERKTDARKIGPHDNIACESALFDRFPVIGFRKRTTRNFPWTLAPRSHRRYQMREYETLRACRLRHGAEIGGGALAIKSIRKHSAAPVRPHNGRIVECTMMSGRFANFST